MDASQSLVSLNDVAYQYDGSPIYLIDQINENQNRQNLLFDRIALKEALSKLDKTNDRLSFLEYFKDSSDGCRKTLNMTQYKISRLERKILAKVKKLLS